MHVAFRWFRIVQEVRTKQWMKNTYNWKTKEQKTNDRIHHISLVKKTGWTQHIQHGDKT